MNAASPAWPLATLALAFMLPASALGQIRINPFNDPFVQVTAAVASCPVPAPPAYDEQEFRDAAHERAQRGTSCWLDGRCRLHNAYLYDAEIIPRVVKAIEHDGGFRNTSLWLLGQRRQVTLMGCVQSQDQARRLKRLAARIDDVEHVVNHLIVGKPLGRAPYPAAGR